MPDHDCAQRGHHFHESDGAIFNRERNQQTVRTRETVDVHCCWCQAAAAKTGYGARIALKEPSTIPCGEFVTL